MEWKVKLKAVPPGLKRCNGWCGVPGITSDPTTGNFLPTKKIQHPVIAVLRLLYAIVSAA